MSGLRILQRTEVAVVLSVAVLSAGLPVGGTAFAHDPVIITDDQTTPEAGPLLPDGTISFALYGVIDAPGATRGLRVRFADSQTVNVTLLVPALEPERALADGDLPTLTVHRPDGSTAVLTTNERVRFDESFSGTSYLRLLELGEPAQAGEYDLTVTSAAPSRFTVSVGTVERFGTPVESVTDRNDGSRGVAEWYATPPPASLATATTVAPTTLPPTTVASSSTEAATTSTPLTFSAATSASGPVVVSSVPHTGGVDGAAGYTVLIGVIAVILGGASFLVWSKRHRGA